MHPGSAPSRVGRWHGIDTACACLPSHAGFISVTRENFERMAKGAVLTSADMYFITAPTFQTAHEKYAWLNHIQASARSPP